MPKNKVAKAEEKNLGMAVVAYIIFLVPLLTEAKNDPFVKFHLSQSIGLIVFGVAVSIIWIIPILGWIIGAIGYVFWFICWIVGIVNAASGKEAELPLIGPLAKKYIKF